MDYQYLKIAIQYYVAGRSATFAGSIPVAGNLFHHAVEMLLKYFLLKHYTAAKLKADFRHDLKKLWREFKKLANKPVLARFDRLVSELNKIEDLRYPGKGYSFIMEPRKGPRPRASGPATKGQKQYRVNLEEIDEYFTELLTGRVTLGWIQTLLRREDAMLQYKRENLHPFA
jgi:hypothetical protein